MGHAGSDVEAAYRSRREIVRDYEKDPLLGTARCLLAAGHATADQVLEWYEKVRDRVMAEAERVLDEPHLSSLDEVMAPLALPEAPGDRPGRVATFRDWARGGLPESGTSLTLAQSINATLAELMDGHPEMLVFGEDVAAKGGVYGVTRGLRSRFGGHRVFDTLLDEQTILGLALGSAWPGSCRCPRSSTSPISTTPRTSSAARRRRCASSRTASTATAWWCGSRAWPTNAASEATSTTTTRWPCCATSQDSCSPYPAIPRTRPGCCARASPWPGRAGSVSCSSPSRCTTRATCSPSPTEAGPRPSRARTGLTQRCLWVRSAATAPDATCCW